MIILCTRCEARFRVADEKIGPRGAKVRCSKCGNVFAVHRDAGTAPGAPPAAAKPPAPRRAPPVAAAPATPPVDIELEAHAARPPAVASPPPPSFPPAPLPDDPFAAVRGPAGDPLAHAGFDADPFAAAASAPASAPSAPAAAAPAFPASAFDPGAVFAEAALGDPFVASVVPRAPRPSESERSALPVTDLSDLLGSAASAAGPAAPEPHLDAGHDAPLELDLGGHGARAAADPAPGYGDVPGFGMDPPFAGDDDAIAIDAGPRGEGGHDAWGTAEASPTAILPPAPPPPPAAEAGALRGPAAAPGPERVAEVEVRPDPGASAVAAGTEAPRRSPMRSVALNAVSLAALLLMVLALLAVWRGGESPSAALRNVTALVGLGDAVAVDEPFPASDVSSGLFDRADGPPVLYVRGTVASRAQADVAGVRVAVEILRAGTVVARGEALAGAVPTPEELHAVRDAADLALRAGEWTRRAPARVAPGEALPFLVAIVDVPADLAGTTVRVTTSAAEPER